MTKELLNIVDDGDNVIGIEDRKIIHEKGLLHREVHVYFITPKNEIIFQHRAKDKDTFPDLLDATVGGHVEIDDSYEQTAIKETLEETGISITKKELIKIEKIYKKSEDNKTGMTNHAFQTEFIYIFEGSVEELKVEEGKALGFEIWSIEKLINIGESERLKFIPDTYNFAANILIPFLKNKLQQI